MEQSKGLAKPRTASPKGGGKPSAVFKGALAGAIVVVAAVAAFWLLTDDKSEPDRARLKSASAV